MKNPKKQNTPVPNSAQPTAPVQTAQPTAPYASANQTKAKELNKAFSDAARLGVVANPQQTTQNIGASQVPATPAPTTAPPQTSTQTPSVPQNELLPQHAPQSAPQNTQPTYGYDPNVDYQALINEAVAAGNYQLAAIYELQRNAKIAGQGMNYEQTNLYSSYLPGGANYSSTTTTYPNLSDLSPMINQLYDAADQQIKTNINYETQQAADQLRRALQDAQGSYEDAIARQLIETQQARDAQALRNQVNGDRGGIGSAQVDSIMNTGAKNREAIAAQQRQLSTDTARQLADLRAQGKYEEANQLLQSAQQRLAALYEEQVRLQQMQETQKSTLASLGSQYLSAGLMPNQAMLDAMGIDAQTAQLYADYAKQQNNASQLAALGSQYLSAGLMPNQAMLDALGIDAATAQQYIDYVNSQAKSGGTSGGEPIIVNGNNGATEYTFVDGDGATGTIYYKDGKVYSDANLTEELDIPVGTALTMNDGTVKVWNGSDFVAETDGEGVGVPDNVYSSFWNKLVTNTLSFEQIDAFMTAYERLLSAEQMEQIQRYLSAYYDWGN